MRPDLTCVTGPPGAGKTTFATMAALDSGGSVFRLREALNPSPGTGRSRSRTTSDPLGWVTNEAVERVLDAAFSRGQLGCGPFPVLLDNFPGDAEQLKMLSLASRRRGLTIGMIELAVDDATLTGRVASRRVCLRCHPDPHHPARPGSNVGGRCGRCGHNLTRRDSDRPEVHRLRLRRFRSNLIELGWTVRALGVAYRLIDAAGAPEEVHRAAQSAWTDLLTESAASPST